MREVEGAGNVGDAQMSEALGQRSESGCGEEFWRRFSSIIIAAHGLRCTVTRAYAKILQRLREAHEVRFIEQGMVE